MKNLPFHWKPRSGRSSGEIGITLKADSMSACCLMSLIASCIVAYWITEISLGMKSFTEEPSTLKEPKVLPSATPILLSIRVTDFHVTMIDV